MGTSRSSTTALAGFYGFVISMGCAGQAYAAPQSITADTVEAAASITRKVPNFQEFDDAVAGELTVAKTVTLHFAQTDALLSISSTPDFQIEAGGTCLKGDVYQANSSCTLRLRFKPQSAGRRLGKLSIEHTASDTPFSLGLGGTAYAPAVSFIPSKIAHVNGTYPSNVGLLKGASSLAISGDTLYIADTGNNAIRQIDSSGAISTISSSSTAAPGGVAADSLGDVYYTEPATNQLFAIYDYGSTIQLTGSGTDPCNTAECSLNAEKLYSPTALVADPYGTLFVTDDYYGAAELFVLPSKQFLRLDDPFPFQTAANYGFGVDGYDNLYTAWSNEVCRIIQQSLYEAETPIDSYQSVAGSRTCGFSGDGGLATNAEISSSIGQITFDLAGNLYFSDSKNNRVRRIDARTGIIRTIAGNGTTGTPSDGGPATSTNVTSPTGLGVDSLGQVYIIAHTLSTGSAQSIRRIDNIGMAVFGSQKKGTTSAAQTVVVSNTGNSELIFTKAVFTGSNAADFSLDANTTSCLLTPGSMLDVGASCVVGILFAPSNTGLRSASLTFLDNTVASSNSILLSGSGTAPTVKVSIAAPLATASITSGTSVDFKVSVTSATGAAPSGSVTFSVDGTAVGAAVKLASGSAAVKLANLSAKTHTLSAAYGGDSNYAASKVSESITVKAAASKSNPPVPAPPIRGPGPVPAS